MNNYYLYIRNFNIAVSSVYNIEKLLSDGGHDPQFLPQLVDCGDVCVGGDDGGGAAFQVLCRSSQPSPMHPCLHHGHPVWMEMLD